MLIKIELRYLGFGENKYYTKKQIKKLIDYFLKQFRFTENWADSTGFLYTPSPPCAQFPLLLTSCINVVYLLQLNQYWYLMVN